MVEITQRKFKIVGHKFTCVLLELTLYLDCRAFIEYPDSRKFLDLPIGQSVHIMDLGQVLKGLPLEK